MGTTAKIIAISYLAVVVIGVAVAVAVVRTTRARGSEPDTEKLAHREKAWLGVVIVLLVALLFGTIFFIPYTDSAGANGQVVKVDSLQFGWVITPNTVEAGTPVEFRLTSRDVNHGFGIYDETGRLLFQIQVIPGETSTGIYTFDDPGTYEVLCLEFCGVGHHLMRGLITVEPAQ